jgi:hypothetical protein
MLLWIAAFCCIAGVATGRREQGGFTFAPTTTRTRTADVAVAVAFVESSHGPRRPSQTTPRSQRRMQVLLALSGSTDKNPATETSTNENNSSIPNIPAGRGLYRPFLEHAWERLAESGYCTAADVDESLAANTATAKGFPPGSVVCMENRALQPTTVDNDNKKSPIRYARAALLETLVAAPESDSAVASDDKIHAAGIQVLNLVIFPASPHVPVFGADFVSLPGNKHLLLLDAQPMTTGSSPSISSQFSERWNDWHARYCGGDTETTNHFPWGGAMPEQVTCYVSPNALWTRLGMAAAAPKDDSDDGNKKKDTPTVMEPVALIQDQLWLAFQEHLDLYLDMLGSEYAKDDNEVQVVENARDDYLRYRLENDPARPMLKSLYGEEWTEKVLTTVLFPPL